MFFVYQFEECSLDRFKIVMYAIVPLNIKALYVAENVIPRSNYKSVFKNLGNGKLETSRTFCLSFSALRFGG